MQPNVTDKTYSQSELLSLISDMRHANKTVPVHSKGLAIYRNNLLMTAKRSLTISYPVLTKMIGEQGITVLASRLLQTERNETGDWALWGTSLSQTIAQSNLIDTHPYLSDMAEFEWRLHLANRTQQGEFNQDSLSQLARADVETLRIKLVEGFTLFQSEYPVDVLHELHRPNDPNYIPTPDVFANTDFDWETKRYIAIHQVDKQADYQMISAAEFNWMHSVTQGVSLGELIDLYPHFDFASWLSKAVEQGWIETLI